MKKSTVLRFASFKSKTVLMAAAVTCVAALSGRAHAATSYSGNGATGFGGPVGNGFLTVSDNGTGDVTFSFTPNGGTLGGQNPAQGVTTSNDLVIYISTGAAGLANTSTLVDNGDEGRRAISGNDNNSGSRTLVNFSSGFAADYAISIQDTAENLFSLPQPNTVDYLTYIPTTSQMGTTDTITFSLADLGLTQGDSFEFEGSLISSQTTAYRSNETFGASVTVPGTVGDTPNAGFAGTTTFSSADTYATSAVPEPTGLGLLVLSGVAATRRRRSN